MDCYRRWQNTYTGFFVFKFISFFEKYSILQEDSIFQMRRPYDLMSLLQQEKRAEVFAKIKTQLMAQKEEIESENC